MVHFNIYWPGLVQSWAAGSVEFIWTFFTTHQLWRYSINLLSLISNLCNFIDLKHDELINIFSLQICHASIFHFFWYSILTQYSTCAVSMYLFIYYISAEWKDEVELSKKVCIISGTKKKKKKYLTNSFQRKRKEKVHNFFLLRKIL